MKFYSNFSCERCETSCLAPKLGPYKPRRHVWINMLNVHVVYNEQTPFLFEAVNPD